MCTSAGARGVAAGVDGLPETCQEAEGQVIP